MRVNSKTIKLQVDCGATVCIIPMSLIGETQTESCNVSLERWNEVKMKALRLGTCKLLVENPNSFELHGKICCCCRESHSSLGSQGNLENGTHYGQLLGVRKCEWSNELIRYFKALTRHFQC